ncbi:MAG TPA: hypothetical protein VII56_17655 [Rhizomicrobium sp.]
MHKLLFAGVSLVSITLATQALALNPQPEPPGRHKGIVAHGTLNTTGAVHAGSSADVDDNYCGTPVPGHPHIGTKCATVHTNAMGGAMTGHANGVIHGGGASADVDDNYCGTPVPGHPHPNANCTVHNNITGAAHGTTATH